MSHYLWCISEKIFIEFITYGFKELLSYKGSVKIDEYYGMFWALYYSNDRLGC